MRIFFTFLSIITNYFMGNSADVTDIHNVTTNMTNMPNAATEVANKNYSYYMLEAQNWCGEGYMIHGLWPQYNSTAYPSWCKNITYTEPTGNLHDLMDNYWKTCNIPNFSDSSALWQHEWQKHGSCVNQQTGMEEDEYFSTALNLFMHNTDRLKKCIGQDCTVGCFDLDFNLRDC